MVDQPIELSEDDPVWVDRFAEQRARLTTILQPWLAGAVEHIGSTSVPGLRAKPIVDLLAPVRSLTEAQAAVPVLDADGWLFWPDDPNRDYRLWFLRPRPERRTHHLQIMQHGHPEFRAVIAFRDALRGDPAAREAYARLKEDLALEHRTDRNAYTNAKAGFVQSVLRSHGTAWSSRKPI